MVRPHPHAKDRLVERGATEDEVIATVESGATGDKAEVVLSGA